MVHNASQAYIVLANQAFKGENALLGENSEKFQTLEEVRLYVKRKVKTKTKQ
jgi:hypothetical protein